MPKIGQRGKNKNHGGNNRKPVAMYRGDVCIEDFDSILEASAEMNFPPQTLRNKLRHGAAEYLGYTWRYVGR